jgi:hypothetical protein
MKETSTNQKCSEFIIFKNNTKDTTSPAQPVWHKYKKVKTKT